MNEITEADEAATSKGVALYNLRAQILHGETEGVIAMYERAAWRAGASVAETEQTIRDTRASRKTGFPSRAGR